MVAILVNNGTFLGDVLEAGSHEWRSEDNAWLLEKGGIKGNLGKFQNRFSLVVKSLPNRKSSLSVCKPIAGNKFGTQNAVEYFSERYQQLLNIRFYGLFDIKVADPVLFYVSSISQQIEDHRAFTLKISLRELSDKISLLKLLLQSPNLQTKTELISIVLMPIKILSTI